MSTALPRPKAKAAPTRSAPKISTNEALINRYISDLQRTATNSTLYGYHAELMSFAEYMGTKSLLTASLEQMTEWSSIPRKRSVKTLSPGTIHRRIMTLRSFYRFLHEVAEVLPKNPARKLTPPQVDNEDPKPVPEHIWTSIWFADLTDEMRVALGLSYFAGLRRHEVTSLRLEQFKDDPVPMIQGMKRKGHKRTGGFRYMTTVRLIAQAFPHLIGDVNLFSDALERHRAAREATGRSLLLSWGDIKLGTGAPRKYPNLTGGIEPQYFNKRLDKLCRDLKVPRITPHQLRHSAATNLILADVALVDAQKMLGHARPDTTVRYYQAGDDPLARYLNDGDNDPPTYGRW